MPPYSDRQILAIEDDPLLSAHLNDHLGRQGFNVTHCNDGLDGLSLVLTRQGDFDLILLDILLPGISGLEVLARLRRYERVPIILMSALGDEQDRITGFSQGADDYLPKPFSMSELQVRIEAIFRRVAYEREQSPPRSDFPLILEDARCDVFYNGNWVGLTPTEYRLLELFAQHTGEVLSKPFLYQQVLRRGYSRHDRSLDMHVSNIRRKLTKAGNRCVRLEAVWGKGYLLSLQDE
ncbi:response regulator transcription factor [Azomonas macrocytogenes]|uniref:Two-component system response regulator PfeR n=1 Tax=Azomonas macrocytogenes TaxID=69962 RepID=A0A839SX61_AZOMA|nr:response regulator transcription factor [Azomonas macrocytogenes]MBB3101702.1 two-component system response regulator PfeR [Azomonas macrocytogenes]